MSLGGILILLAGAAQAANESFRPDLASLGLDLSNAAYCQSYDISSWSCLPCQRLQKAGAVPLEPPVVIDGFVRPVGEILPKPANHWSTRAVITVLSGERIAVSFRGSANLTNWLEDFDFVELVPYKEACPSCRVHKGFYNSWLSLSQRVVNNLLPMLQKYPKADILVTGHSLGAAQAVLAAAQLYYREGMNVTNVYTFGQPRVGNQEFHRFFNDGIRGQSGSSGSAFRVVHWRDPIPLVPFRWMDFEHTNTEVWYNENSTTYKVCDSSGEDPTCSRSMPAEPWRITDHVSYLDRPTGGAACMIP